MKKINIFMTVLLILSIFLPVVTFGESETSSDATDQTTVSSDLFSSGDSWSSSSEASSATNSVQIENQTNESESSSEVSQEESEESTVTISPLANYSSNVTIDDWQLRDENDIPLSEANPARSNQHYDFEFAWSLSLAETEKLQPNDTIVIPFLKNTQWAIEEGWEVFSSDPVAFNAEVNGNSISIGTWQVVNSGGNKEIKIVFGTGVTGLNINSITGVEFTLSEKSVSCYTSKGGHAIR